MVENSIHYKQLQEIFCKICKELIEKIPEKTNHFRALQRESEIKYFPLLENCAMLVYDNLSILNSDTIEEYFRTLWGYDGGSYESETKEPTNQQ